MEMLLTWHKIWLKNGLKYNWLKNASNIIIQIYYTRLPLIIIYAHVLKTPKEGLNLWSLGMIALAILVSCNQTS
jgi:hypothetical protein